MRRYAALLCLFGLVAWNHPPAPRDPGGRRGSALVASRPSGRGRPVPAAPDGTVVLSRRATVPRPAARRLAGVRVEAARSAD